MHVNEIKELSALFLRALCFICSPVSNYLFRLDLSSQPQQFSNIDKQGKTHMVVCLACGTCFICLARVVLNPFKMLVTSRSWKERRSAWLVWPLAALWPAIRPVLLRSRRPKAFHSDSHARRISGGLSSWPVLNCFQSLAEWTRRRGREIIPVSFSGGPRFGSGRETGDSCCVSLLQANTEMIH